MISAASAALVLAAVIVPRMMAVLRAPGAQDSEALFAAAATALLAAAMTLFLGPLRPERADGEALSAGAVRG